MPAEDRGTRAARCRVVLLGASNLIRSLNTAFDVCRQHCEVPLDMLCAAGHGRSYGSESTFFRVRRLPAILECGLWESLADRPPRPTFGMITDIGNDLLYERLPQQIVDWVDRCLDRLLPYTGNVVIGRLPQGNLVKIGRSRFEILRRLTYPSSRLTYRDAMARVVNLNQRLDVLAEQHGLRTWEPSSDWYGFDPIHIKPRYYEAAWAQVMATWNSNSEHNTPTRNTTWIQWLRMQRLRPLRRTMFGIEQRADQPALVDQDGSWLSLF